MSQPQQLSVACNFQGFLVCQMPKDVVEVELEIKTKWGKFILHVDHHTRTDKYKPWNKVSHPRIHSRRRQPYHERTGKPHLNCSTNSGTFIHSGQGMGYPPKIFVDSDSESDIPPHIPDLEDYCRMCLLRKVWCTCKPMSNWSADLIDITQPDHPNPDSSANKGDRDDIQDQALPSDWSDQDKFWLGKTYNQIRPITSLKPVPVPPPVREDEESNWSQHFHPHNYRAKVPSQASSSKPPPGWPKGIRTNPNTNPITLPHKQKGQNSIGLCITKIASIFKEAFDALD